MVEENNQQNSGFHVGDVVKLKISNAPEMVISRITNYPFGVEILCIYFDANNNLHDVKFDENNLRKMINNN